MRGLRAAGSIRANSPKLKNHRLSRWIFILHIENLSVQNILQDGSSTTLFLLNKISPFFEIVKVIVPEQQTVHVLRYAFGDPFCAIFRAETKHAG